MRARIHAPVFFTSAGVILAFVLFGSIFTGRTAATFGAIQDFIIINLGWFYIAAVGFFLLFVIWLVLSRYGDIRLGGDDERPAYSTTTWFAMLFSAGMGIGLLFFSVAEPIMHFEDPPGGATPQTLQAAKSAMMVTFFHWGLHAWAIYVIVGLALAYFAYRHDLPLTIRSAFYPLLGQRIHGAFGNLIDILAVFGTLFGIATSLGLGVMQINSGFAALGVMEVSVTTQLFLIAAITIAATASVVSGLDRGIRRLSELNILLGAALMVFVLLAGPTVFLISSLVQSIGIYAQNLLQMTFRTDAFIGTEWQGSWTMFYWGWWISWSPFVGMFIARVSRGRTIREFIVGVLLAPTLFGFMWLVIFGNTALHAELFGSGGIVEAVDASVPSALYVMLEGLPWAAFSSAIATIVIAVYFITSSDSGSLVIDILTSGGHPNPPLWTRIFWALTEGAVAAVLLVSGGLAALQTAAITTALPFTVVLLIMCWSLVKGLRAEPGMHPVRLGGEVGDRLKPLPQPRALAGIRPASPGHQGRMEKRMQNWRQYLRDMLRRKPMRQPGVSIGEARDQIQNLFERQVLPAFRELKEELERHERDAKIDRGPGYASLTVYHQGEEEFSYAVRGHVYHKMSYAFPEFGGEDAERRFSHAEIMMHGETKDREMADLTRDSLIEDFLTEYRKWMGW